MMNKNLKYYLIILSLLLFAFSCKLDEDPIDGFSNEPVFIMDAVFDQNELKIEAGDGNYYLFTDFEKDDLDVYFFSGTFGQQDSLLEDVDELTFSIRSNIVQNPNNNFSISENIFEGFFEYKKLPDTLHSDSYKYNFSSSFFSLTGSTPNVYTWNFPNSTSNTENPEIVRNDSSPFQVSLSAGDNNGCTSYYSSIVFPNNTNCKIDFDVENDSLNAAVVLSVLNDFLFDSIIWEVPGSSVMVGSSIQISANQILNTQGTEIIVSTINNSGCDNEVSVFVAPFSPVAIFPVEACITSFDYEVEPFTSAQLDLSSISISFNYEGIEYRSDLKEQPQSSFFEIVSIENFEYNENGFPTKKLNVNFECMLYNLQEEDFPFSGNGVIGIAYPE